MHSLVVSIGPGAIRARANLDTNRGIVFALHSRLQEALLSLVASI